MLACGTSSLFVLTSCCMHRVLPHVLCSVSCSASLHLVAAQNAHFDAAQYTRVKEHCLHTIQTCKRKAEHKFQTAPSPRRQPT